MTVVDEGAQAATRPFSALAGVTHGGSSGTGKQDSALAGDTAAHESSATPLELRRSRGFQRSRGRLQRSRTQLGRLVGDDER
jgi:hypothetical protein